MDKNFYVKYIHLFFGHDNKFSGPLVSLINNPDNGFNATEHIFITRYPAVFEQLKQYPNVVLDTDKRNFYRKYYKHCHLIISHGGEGGIKELLTPKHIKKQIVYRYWGGSKTTHLKFNSNNPIINFVRKLKVLIFKKNYSAYAAIGIANTTDIVDLSPLLPNQKYYRLAYCSNEKDSAIKKTKEKLPVHNDKPKILLGHRGTKENNHIDILKQLQKYDLDKFEIYIPLSYGNKDYISSVKQYILNNCNSNVHIIDEFMDYPQYIEFLSTMDIGIFDGITSYALGNICLLLYFRKTLYLNPNGVIAQALNKEDGPYKDINEIGITRYEDFVSLIHYRDDYVSDLEYKSIEDSVLRWKHMFQDLENIDK